MKPNCKISQVNKKIRNNEFNLLIETDDLKHLTKLIKDCESSHKVNEILFAESEYKYRPLGESVRSRKGVYYKCIINWG